MSFHPVKKKLKKSHPLAPENTDLIKRSASDLLFSKKGGKSSIYRSHSQRETASSSSVLNASTIFTPSSPAAAAIPHLNLLKASPTLWQKQSHNGIPCSLAKGIGSSHTTLPGVSYAHTAELWHCGPAEKFRSQPYRKGRGDVL